MLAIGGDDSPFWCFGKSDGTDVRLPENFCWGVGGWIIVFLTSETSQYYKVCEGTACAQLAEYNKVRLQRKCRDVRVGGFCGLGHALPLLQSLAMHDKYTNTQVQTQMQKTINTQIQNCCLLVGSRSSSLCKALQYTTIPPYIARQGLVQ